MQKQEADKALAGARGQADKVLSDARQAAETQKQEAEQVLSDARQAAEMQKQQAEQALSDARQAAETQKQQAEQALSDARQAAETQKQEADNFAAQVKAFVDKVNVTIGAMSHLDALKQHNTSANRWMFGAGVFLISLILFASLSLSNSSAAQNSDAGQNTVTQESGAVREDAAAPKSNSSAAQNSDAGQNTDTQESGTAREGAAAPNADIWMWFTNFANRILIVAILSYGMFFCAKNYMAHRHNAIINSHRLTALHSYAFLARLTKDQDTDNRSIILTQVAQSIFGSQDPGFIRGGNSQGGHISLSNIIPKPKDISMSNDV